jgi:hypothetical protein
MEHELRDSEKPDELRPNLNQFYNLEQDLQLPPSDFEGGFSSHEKVNADDNLNHARKPKVYFEAHTGSVIDKKFFKYFIRSGVNPENVYDLGLLLRESSVPEVRRTPYNRPDTKTWDEERYKTHGKWLMNTVAPPHTKKIKKINVDVIDQARRLGIGPSIYTINRKFGNTKNYYKNINAVDSRNVGTFDNWSTEDYIKHIKWIASKIGSKPTKNDLSEFARKNPWKYPSTRRIELSVGGQIGKIGPAMELAGYFDIDNWNDDDYLEWGVKFMKANDGMEVSSPVLQYLSKNDLGPSARSIYNNFGINKYKQQVNELYIENKNIETENRKIKLSAIESELEKNIIPRELFESAESEEDMILFYSKYKVIDHLCPDWEESTKIIVSTRGFHEKNFVGSIRKLNIAITAGDIESAAIYLDVFDDIWPMTEYMQTYKLNDGYAEYRKVLAEKEKIRSRKRTESGVRRRKNQSINK